MSRIQATSLLLETKAVSSVLFSVALSGVGETDGEEAVGGGVGGDHSSFDTVTPGIDNRVPLGLFISVATGTSSESL